MKEIDSFFYLALNIEQPNTAELHSFVFYLKAATVSLPWLSHWLACGGSRGGSVSPPCHWSPPGPAESLQQTQPVIIVAAGAA